MFVRVKTTPNSPRKSVQIVQSVRKGDKVIQKIVRHIGIAMDETELEQLIQLAETIKIKLEAGNQQLLFSPEQLAKISGKSRRINKKAHEETESEYTVNIKDLEEEDRTVSGIHDIYGKLFDELGYSSVLKNPARNKSSVEIFKNIVLARIANPDSKRASVHMLEEDFGITLNLDYVYKMMDKLDDHAIERLNRISYQNTRSLYKEKINVVFYDCTTIYFEAFKEDSLREFGFSKDHKFNQVQVLLCLMVTQEGLPVGYQVYEGSKYEGHTLIPALNEIRKKYDLNQVVFVADSGMMNEKNLDMMETEQLNYIVGSRLKSLPKKLKKQLLNPENYTKINDQYSVARFEHNGRTLIVNYTQKRAKKDAYEREKTIQKLMKKIAKEKNPKSFLSNFGYKKYLKINGDASIGIDEDKILQDSQWDGLHGMITNCADLSNEQIFKQYYHLWQVEESFRVTKHDLKIRPVFHWKPRRVKAHLALSFAAYSLIRFLEYRVKLQYIKLSPEVIRQTLLHVQTSILYDKQKKIRFGLPSKMSIDAKKIYALMNFYRSTTPYIISKL